MMCNVLFLPSQCRLMQLNLTHCIFKRDSLPVSTFKVSVSSQSCIKSNMYQTLHLYLKQELYIVQTKHLWFSLFLLLEQFRS